jgi:hypothetical protein
MIGKALLYTGLAMIAAAALRAVIDLLRADPFDPWAAVLAAGCILASIGVGLTRSKPWKKIEEETKKLGRPRSDDE